MTKDTITIIKWVIIAAVAILIGPFVVVAFGGALFVGLAALVLHH